MSEPSPIKRDTPDDVSSTSQPGYLYHQQVPDTRPRGPRGPQRPRPRPPKHHNLAHQALVTNIRTFSVAAAFMFLLLLLAFHISRKSWSRKETRMTAGAATALTGRPPRTHPLDEIEAGPLAAPESIRRSELDTEAMRKAVFLARRGDTFEAEGDYTEAIAQYREALDVWPHLTAVWAQLGRTYLRVGDHARAQIALERAVANDPANPETLNDLGVACLYRNMIDRAQDLFEAAVEIEPQFADSYFNTALCHLAAGRRAEADAAIDRYLRLRPGDPRALKEKAYLDASSGDYAEAIKALELALAEAPDWAPLHFDAAATSALMGRVREALAHLERGEALTSPAVAYRVYLQPAFKEVRLSEAGHLFEAGLADRARGLMAEAEGAAPETQVTQPLSSVSGPAQTGR
ncbi:MAG: tetratricopeptide repeat protein [Kiritimatiellae bacterium]|nr:tetratricopeptide repeat protein [Kiritimatiellia bacterium]